MTEPEGNKTKQNTTTDGGYGWVVVFAAFMIHFIMGGILYTFGVLYTEFLDEFDQGKGDTAWMSSFTPGIMYIIGPVVGALTSRFGCRLVVITGAVIVTTGFVLSSFATSIFHLYYSFGIVPGIGFGFIVLPTLVCVNKYFVKKRSFAMGITVCGSGIGIFAFAQLVRFLLDEYGWRGTLQIEAGLGLNIAVFAAFLRPVTLRHKDGHLDEKKYGNRQTESKPDINKTICYHFSNFFSRHFAFSLMKDPIFLMFTTATLFNAVGYGVPYTFLPDRAEEKGVDKYGSAFLISTMGITNVVGRLFFGWLADQTFVNRIILYGVSILICGISNFINPVNDSYEYLLVYAAIQGMFGGVFISLKTVVLADLIGLDMLDKGFGLLAAFGGISTLIGPPISGWLYDGTGSYDATFYFIGCCMVFGGIVALFIPVQQKVSEKTQKSKLDKNINLETIQTKF